MAEKFEDIKEVLQILSNDIETLNTETKEKRIATKKAIDENKKHYSEMEKEDLKAHIKRLKNLDKYTKAIEIQSTQFTDFTKKIKLMGNTYSSQIELISKSMSGINKIVEKAANDLDYISGTDFTRMITQWKGLGRVLISPIKMISSVTKSYGEYKNEKYGEMFKEKFPDQGKITRTGPNNKSPEDKTIELFRKNLSNIENKPIDEKTMVAGRSGYSDKSASDKILEVRDAKKANKDMNSNFESLDRTMKKGHKETGGFLKTLIKWEERKWWWKLAKWLLGIGGIYLAVTALPKMVGKFIDGLIPDFIKNTPILKDIYGFVKKIATFLIVGKAASMAGSLLFGKWVNKGFNTLVKGLFRFPKAMTKSTKLFSTAMKHGQGVGKSLAIGGKKLVKELKTPLFKFGKDATLKTVGKTVAKEGAVKTIGKAVVKEGAEKVAAKSATKGLAKFFGKKIPIIGTALAGAFALGRVLKGDFAGAGLELLSGIPIVGLAADAALIYKDLKTGEGRKSYVEKLRTLGNAQLEQLMEGNRNVLSENMKTFEDVQKEYLIKVGKEKKDLSRYELSQIKEDYIRQKTLYDEKRKAAEEQLKIQESEKKTRENFGGLEKAFGMDRMQQQIRRMAEKEYSGSGAVKESLREAYEAKLRSQLENPETKMKAQADIMGSYLEREKKREGVTDKQLAAIEKLQDVLTRMASGEEDLSGKGGEYWTKAIQKRMKMIGLEMPSDGYGIDRLDKKQSVKVLGNTGQGMGYNYDLLKENEIFKNNKLRLTSTLRPNSITAANKLSYHALGQAADIGASTPGGYDNPKDQLAMTKLAQWAAQSGNFAEVLWNTPGHYDHVHLSWDKKYGNKMGDTTLQAANGFNGMIGPGVLGFGGANMQVGEKGPELLSITPANRLRTEPKSIEDSSISLFATIGKQLNEFINTAKEKSQTLSAPITNISNSNVVSDGGSGETKNIDQLKYFPSDVMMTNMLWMTKNFSGGY